MKENLAGYPGVAGPQEVVDVDEYSRTTRACHKTLKEIWRDLELSDVAQDQQLKDISERALGVWNGAVEHAEQHQQSIRSRIEEAAAEMRTIAEQLGELSAIEDPNASMGSLAISPGKTLKRQFDEVMGELENWKRKKEARIAEHDSIQGQINVIREALEMVTCSTKKAKNAITRGNMDFLKLELERMRGEKVRRERKMDAALARLRKLCIELGADDGDIAASVHPSLRVYHAACRGHYFSSYTSAAPPAARPGNADQAANSGMAPPPAVPMSDAVFSALDSRIDELVGLREEREGRLGEMQEVLHNMWAMLEVAADDENRRFFEVMLQAPARLHQHTLDKCNEEIGRLEAEQAKVMRVMIQTKSLEIGKLCDSTGLPAPDLSILLDDSDSAGQIADALNKLVRMLAEVTMIVEQREPVMRAIAEVEGAFREALWHRQHQQDNLFNNRGRDANRLLQRVIRAEEKKKKLPKQLAKLRSALDNWSAMHGAPFVLGTLRYRDEVLALMEGELAEMALERPVAKVAEKKRPGTSGGRPPRDPAGKHPVATAAAPESAALRAISVAHDAKSASAPPPLFRTQSALDRPTTAPAPRGGAGMQRPGLIPSAPALSGGSGGGVGGAAGPAFSSAGSVAGDAASVSEAPTMPTPVMFQGTGRTNPLQDLVNSLANASAASHNAGGGRGGGGTGRYNAFPTLASLQLNDDAVNTGSANPSPSPMAGRAGALLGKTATPHLEGSLTPVTADQPSPAHSAHSHRSIRSEALSHLSGHTGGITIRKRNKENRTATPTSAKRSPVPEHSVMHTGMML